MRALINDYCARIGQNALLVQGAGGNVSWKEEETLWIKASGTWLRDAQVKDIFVPVDLPALQTALSAGDFNASPQLKALSSLKPSIETVLHGLMPQRVVVHLHAVEALAHLVRADFASTFKLLDDQSINWLAVPYAKPGAKLARSLALALSERPNPSIIFLQNHGVVVGGENIDEISDLLNRVTTALATTPLFNAPPTHLPHEAITRAGIDYMPIADTRLHHLAYDPFLFSTLKSAWALYPDHVVFLGEKPECYETISEFHSTQKTPSISIADVVFVRAHGVYVNSNFKAAMQAQLACYYDVLCRQRPGNQLQPLKTSQIAELLNWDAERYRQHLSR